MALQPPSFFQARLPKTLTSQQQSKDGGKPPSSQTPSASRDVSCASQLLPTGPVLTSHGLQVPASQQVQAAVLTNDLLAVEAHLQSRMRLLEEEKRNLIGKIVELEKNLAQQKEEREAQLQTLTAQNDLVLLQTQSEVKQLSTECLRLKEESVVRTTQLEREMRTREEQHLMEVESLSGKLKEQEAHVEALTMELERSRETSEGALNQLKEQLTTSMSEQARLKTELEGQLRSMSEELRQSHQRVCELESYLGGEMPCLPVEKDGRSLTWIEERDRLNSTIKTLEHDLHKVQSEDKLLNVRLTAIMEILAIQETTIAKQGQSSFACGSREKDAESATAVQILLTRWREKVFVMLVQQKLSEIYDARTKREALKKEAELREQLQIVEGERALLSHSLADRSAELQLQIGKTNSAEERLDESLKVTQRLQHQLQAQSDYLSCVVGRIRSMSVAQDGCMAVVNQALTKMANYDHRLNMMKGRINSAKATLSYKRAIQRTHKSIPTVDCDVQTEYEGRENSEMEDLTSLSRLELISEVRSLSKERTNLVHQLEESTAAFKQQLDTLNETSCSKLAAARGELSSMKRENCSLNEELCQLKSEVEALTKAEEELKLKVEELENELREAKSTMETRVDMAVREQQQLNSEGMAEMEKLLSVARREHGKAVVQLQQLQRQLSRDKDRAVEAMKLNQTRLQQQLDACRRKLEASQVERNLFMTVLGQEGIAVPVKSRVSPRKRISSDVSDKQDKGRSSGCSDCLQEDRHSESEDTVSSGQLTPAPLEHPDSHSQDIREVLKDLQTLSSSLLEMEKPQTVNDEMEGSKHNET